MVFDVKECVALLEQCGGDMPLIALLEELQAHYRYLPRPALLLLSERLGIPMSQIYSVATFYGAFSLTPRGRHLVSICVGTACHVRGSGRVLERVGARLGIGPGETSADMEYTLHTVNCLGACALGPVMVVDGEYHGQMSPAKVDTLLARDDRKGGNP